MQKAECPCAGLQGNAVQSVFHKKSRVKMGISLCSKVSDQIKLKENSHSFKKDLKSFLL
jgi:hypothetical protein